MSERPTQNAGPSRDNAALWVGAALAIGHSIQVHDGMFEPRALAWVALGTAVAWMGLFFACEPKFATRGLCVLGLAVQIYQLFRREAIFGFDIPRGFYWTTLPLMVATALAALFLRKTARNVCVAAFVAIFFAAGAWLIIKSAPPHIDVYEVTKDACGAMKQGRNPYAIDFPFIYTDHPEWEPLFYPPGYVYDGRVHFGYQYMPLSLLVDFAGHLIGGDFRYGNLAAMAAAGALIGFSGAGFLSAAGAILLLTTPRGFFVIQMGWAEPVVVLCLALVVFCARRWPAALPFAAGLLLASKQHLLLAAPALWLVMPGEGRWKFALKAAATAAVVTLPMVLWNPQAFWHSAIDVQIANPFRIDSLNFAVWWMKLGHAQPAGWISFVLGAMAAIIVAWRGPKTVAGFAGGVAVIYLTFFALSKQTFCNYYFLVVGALCCAVAASGKKSEPI